MDNNDILKLININKEKGNLENKISDFINDNYKDELIRIQNFYNENYDDYIDPNDFKFKLEIMPYDISNIDDYYLSITSDSITLDYKNKNASIIEIDKNEKGVIIYNDIIIRFCLWDMYEYSYGSNIILLPTILLYGLKQELINKLKLELTL